MFDRWSGDLGRLSPGTVISTRDVTRTAAPVVTAPISSARLIKFRSTDTLGSQGGPAQHLRPVVRDRATFGTATIVVPRTQRRGPLPILVNNLPIDSLGTACTPGYDLAHGFSIATNPTDLIPPTTQLALARGYAVLIPDHQGPRMA